MNEVIFFTETNIPGQTKRTEIELIDLFDDKQMHLKDDLRDIVIVMYEEKDSLNSYGRNGYSSEQTHGLTEAATDGRKSTVNMVFTDAEGKESHANIQKGDKNNKKVKVAHGLRSVMLN